MREEGTEKVKRDEGRERREERKRKKRGVTEKEGGKDKRTEERWKKRRKGGERGRGTIDLESILRSNPRVLPTQTMFSL